MAAKAAAASREGGAQEAAAAEQTGDPTGAHNRGALRNARPPAEPDTDVMQPPPHAGSGAQGSWQLCPLSKVGMAGRHAIQMVGLPLGTSLRSMPPCVLGPTVLLCAADQDEGPCGSLGRHQL